MAKIQELSSGQAPSLLDARKGNELIKSINGLLESRSSQKAEIAGITLRVLDSGKIELDVSQNVIDMLTPSEEEVDEEPNSGDGNGTSFPSGYGEKTFKVIENGNLIDLKFLVK